MLKFCPDDSFFVRGQAIVGFSLFFCGVLHTVACSNVFPWCEQHVVRGEATWYLRREREGGDALLGIIDWAVKPLNLNFPSACVERAYSSEI